MELVKKFGKRTLRSIPVIGLFMFMLFIFLPAEVLYANTKELPFVYGEFSKDLTILAVGITVADFWRTMAGDIILHIQAPVFSNGIDKSVFYLFRLYRVLAFVVYSVIILVRYQLG